MYDLRCNNKRFVLDKPKKIQEKEHCLLGRTLIWSNRASSAKDQNISLEKFKIILDPN